jgi:hypothetical protein
MSDIKRLTEIYLCDKLAAATGGRFFPFSGFGLNEENLEPPFTVVAISEAEKRFAQANIWHMTGTIQVITHADEATSEEHSEMVGVIYDALNNINIEKSDAFIFHGLNITNTRSSQDEGRQAHADIIDFACGATG